MTATTLAPSGRRRRQRPLARPPACCAEVRPSPLDASQARQQALRFKALADPYRLRILALLAAQPGPLCVCDIEAQFDLAQPTISHHLRVLREAGLVTATRSGLGCTYTINPDSLAAVRHALDTFDLSSAD